MTSIPENGEHASMTEEDKEGDNSAHLQATEGHSLGESPDSSPSEVEADQQEQVEIFKDKYVRLLAEFENYKRRAQRDQQDSIRFANESLLKNLLPTIDNLERAIQCAKDSGVSGALLEGVELTHKQFLETVGKMGVKQISSAGETFDPTMHQAVAQVEADGSAPNTVVEEFQKGYFLHERILRPAMVTVAKDTSDSTKLSSKEETGEQGGIEA